MTGKIHLVELPLWHMSYRVPMHASPMQRLITYARSKQKRCAQARALCRRMPDAEHTMCMHKAWSEHFMTLRGQCLQARMHTCTYLLQVLALSLPKRMSSPHLRAMVYLAINGMGKKWRPLRLPHALQEAQEQHLCCSSCSSNLSSGMLDSCICNNSSSLLPAASCQHSCMALPCARIAGCIVLPRPTGLSCTRM